MTAACWQIYMWRVYDDDTGWSVNAPPSDWDGGRGPRKKLQIHFDWLLLRKARWPWKGTIQLHDFRTLKNLHRIDIDSGRFSLPLDIYWQSGRFHRTWSRWSRQESWIGGAGHRPVHNYEINWSILLNWFLKTIYGIVRYHGMHPVVALGVRHEGLPQLVHLLVFQLLNQEVVRIKKGPGIGGENHLGHFMAVRHFVPDFSTIVASYHNLGWIQVRCWIQARWRNFEAPTFLPIFGSMSAGPGSSNLGWASVHLGPAGQNPAR